MTYFGQFGLQHLVGWSIDCKYANQRVWKLMQANFQHFNAKKRLSKQPFPVTNFQNISNLPEFNLKQSVTNSYAIRLLQ